TGEGLDERGVLRGIAEGHPELLDRVVEPLVEVHVDIRGPQPLPQLLARHHLARALEEEREEPERPVLKRDLPPVAAKLARAHVHLENAEAHDGARPCGRYLHRSWAGYHRDEVIRHSKSLIALALAEQPRFRAPARPRSSWRRPTPSPGSAASPRSTCSATRWPRRSAISSSRAGSIPPPASCGRAGRRTSSSAWPGAGCASKPTSPSGSGRGGAGA